jgi:hypothetical protein
VRGPGATVLPRRVRGQTEHIRRADQHQQRNLAQHISGKEAETDPVVGPRDAALHLADAERRQRRAGDAKRHNRLRIDARHERDSASSNRSENDT